MSSTSPLLRGVTAAEKRRRPTHDVDGPHTELLGCKKRRLRRDLITSRLSRPYSMPATHIIHRETSAAGDQRFMKLAAVARSKKLNAVVVPTPEDDYETRILSGANAGYRRQRQAQGPVVPLNQTGNHHMQVSSEIVRRAAILNRIRLKVRNERSWGSLTAAEAVGRPCTVVASDRSSLFGGTDIRWKVMNATGGSEEEASTAGSSSNGRATTVTTTATAAEETGSNSTAANVLPLGHLSARLQPLRSPELRAARGQQITKVMDEDELDDDSLSFLGNSVLLFADEDEEAAADSCLGEVDVYADFSIIFGDGSGGENDSGVADNPGNSNSNNHSGVSSVVACVGTEHYEDYMDDLDGIPRAVR